jgi:hypothetical protein
VLTHSELEFLSRVWGKGGSGEKLIGDGGDSQLLIDIPARRVIGLISAIKVAT